MNGIIKKYKHKNKIIGTIKIFFSDSDCQIKYAVESRKPTDPNRPYSTFFISFDSEEKAIAFADEFFTDILNNDFFMQGMGFKK